MKTLEIIKGRRKMFLENGKPGFSEAAHYTPGKESKAPIHVDHRKYQEKKLKRNTIML